MESQRMCICCRQMKDKKELIRIVKNQNGEIFIDQTGKKNGRGAYVCTSNECLKKLQKNKMLNKAFKCAVPDEIYQTLQEACIGHK